MNNWHILTECYVDTLLAEVVSPPKKKYNHQHCCTKVLRTMKETEIKLKKIFSALKQNENSDFYKLAQWIEFFKTNPYNLNLQSF
jgi:hypothetical protein